MKKHLQIFLCIILVIFTVKSALSKDIIIDSNFSYQDIYNALEIKDNSLQTSFTFPLRLYNYSGKNQQLYLSIINPTIDKIVIYNANDSLILGDNIPFTKRDFKHINHVYSFFIAQDSMKAISVVVYNSFQHLLNFRLNIATENTFIKVTNHDYFFNGIFYGILFMYLLLLISIYIFSKNKFFNIYIIINIFTLLIIMQYSGFGYQYVWFYSALVQKYIIVFTVIGYLTAHILFIRSFFSVQLKNQAKNIISILLILTILFGIILFAKFYNNTTGYLPDNYYYLLVNVLFLLYGGFVLTMSIYAYLESKRKEFVWVFIGMILQLFSWIIFINNDFIAANSINYLDNIKLFRSNLFLPHINYCIYLFEMFIVTIFIANNYHVLIRQNDLSAQRLEFYQKRNLNTFVLGQEEEREKITKEIEEDISKDIQSLKKILQSFQPMQDEKKVLPAVLNEIDKTLSDINNITGNYVAPDIQQMKLTEIITTATDKLFQQLKVEYDFAEIPKNFKLSSVANINLYRIFQEVSNNIIKHSKASIVKITAIKDHNTLQIKISDDGVGFDRIDNKEKGIGLLNIESRINSLNGNFHVMSNMQNGTTIHLIMKLKDIS